MDKIFQTGLWKKIQAGELPTVEVSLSDKALFSLAGSLLLVGLALILAGKIVKTL